MSAKPIWVDLDNSPHVPFFMPIVERLRAKGLPVIITARDAYNVTDLVRLYQLECSVIGRHFGKSRGMKVLGLGVRAAQLGAFMSSKASCLAVSHGSRAQMLAAKVLRVRSVVIADYEHVTHLTRPDYLIVPDVIPTSVADSIGNEVLRYPGIKEDVYAANFAPGPAPFEFDPADIVVTARPPASEAHYHRHESDVLFDATLRWLLQDARTRVVLLPRNERQKAAIEAQFAAELQAKKIVIPSQAIDGLNLVWHSDLVISGGGTMNREAAALGVPVYSTFRGPIGAVDKYLSASGRLVLLESPDHARSTVVVAKRNKSNGSTSARNAGALATIVSHITELARARG